MKRLSASILLFIGGILAAISALVPWWSLSGSGGFFNGASIQFLPGGSYSETYAGASASQTYTSGGIGTVGGLYESILAFTIAIVVLGILAGSLAVVGSLGRLRNPSRYSTIRGLSILVVVLALVVVIMVPFVQPYAFHAANPSNMCGSSGGLKTPCNSFWGSASASGESISWGADTGWFLAIASVVFLVAAVVVWISSSAEAWGAIGYLGGPSTVPAGWAPPGGAAGPDLDRLVQLKQLVDSGHLTPAEFQEVKARILGIQSSASPTPPAVVAPEDELKRLKSMHDSGVITDAEYEELRKRVLARL